MRERFPAAQDVSNGKETPLLLGHRGRGADGCLYGLGVGRTWRVRGSPLLVSTSSAEKGSMVFSP